MQRELHGIPSATGEKQYWVTFAASASDFDESNNERQNLTLPAMHMARAAATRCMLHVAAALLLARGVVAVVDPCSFQPVDGSSPAVASPTFAEVSACFAAIPFNASRAVAAMTSIRAALDNYSFKQVLTATGQPWNRRIHLTQLLDGIEAGSYASDFQFHEALHIALSSLNDAHTVYVKPQCYAVEAVQPLGISAAMESNALVLRVSDLFLHGVSVTGGHLPTSLLGAEIVAIDGVKALLAITNFADGMPDGGDGASRFTAAITRFSYVFRRTQYHRFPTTPSTTYTLRALNQSIVTLTLPWLFYTDPGMPLANITAACEPTVTQAVNCSAQASRRLEADTQTDTGSYDVGKGEGLTASEVTQQHRLARLSAGVPQHIQDARIPVFLSRAVVARHAAQRRMQASPDAWPLLDYTRQLELGSGLPAHRQLQQGGSEATITSAGGAASLSDTVTLVSNQIAGYGVYLLHDTNLNAIRLRLSTFQPAAIRNCFSGSPCLNTAQQTAELQCYNSAVNAMLQYAVYDTLENMVSVGASTLVIDVTGNGGGNVALGQNMLAAFSTALHDNPRLLMGVFDVSTTPLYASVLSFVSTHAAVDDVTPYLSAYAARSASGEVSPRARNDTEWYTRGRTVFQGEGVNTVSDPFSLFDLRRVAESVRRAPLALTNANLVIVTDGLCGSMCGQFVKTLHQHGLARVVSVGGLPGTVGDTVSFVGGFVESLSSLADGLLVLGQSGWQVPNNVEPIVHLPYSSEVTLNFGAMYSWLSASDYMQFSSQPAELRVYVWGDTSSGSVDAAVRAAIPAVLSQSVMLPNGVYASGVNLDLSNNEAKYRNATVALGILFGATVLVLLALLVKHVYTSRAGRAKRTITQQQRITVAAAPEPSVVATYSNPNNAVVAVRV